MIHKEIIRIADYDRFVNSNNGLAISINYKTLLSDMRFWTCDAKEKLIFLHALLLTNSSGILYHTMSDYPYTTEELISLMNKKTSQNWVWEKALRNLIDKNLLVVTGATPTKHINPRPKISNEYGDEWNEDLRMSIRKRDGFRCRVCAKDGIQVHHIDYNKTNCAPINLITLCMKCHNKTNRRRPYWQERLQKEQEIYVNAMDKGVGRKDTIEH